MFHICHNKTNLVRWPLPQVLYGDHTITDLGTIWSQSPKNPLQHWDLDYMYTFFYSLLKNTVFLLIRSNSYLHEMHYTKNSVQSYQTLSLKWVRSRHKINTAPEFKFVISTNISVCPYFVHAGTRPEWVLFSPIPLLHKIPPLQVLLPLQRFSIWEKEYDCVSLAVYTPKIGRGRASLKGWLKLNSNWINSVNISGLSDLELP